MIEAVDEVTAPSIWGVKYDRAVYGCSRGRPAHSLSVVAS
jgi:hypothetical protein